MCGEGNRHIAEAEVAFLNVNFYLQEVHKMNA